MPSVAAVLRRGPVSGTLGVTLSRRTYWAALIFLVAFGVAATAYYFLQTLGMSERAKATGRSISLESLQRSHFMVVDGINVRYFILRGTDDQITVFNVPYDKSKGVLMPDIKWFRYGGRCRDFGPDTVDSEFTRQTIFRCKDTSLDPERAALWQWDITGQCVGSKPGYFEALPIAPARLGWKSVLVPNSW